MKHNIVLDLYKTGKSVFTSQELSLMYPSISAKNLKRRLSYYVSQGTLRRLRRGIFATSRYDVRELGQKIFTPSYVSLETILFEHGVIFQKYSSIFLLSYLSRSVQVDTHTIVYRKAPNHLLLNTEGIIRTAGYYAATKERAFLDAVYLYKDYYFDNLGALDWESVMNLRGIYKSKILIKRVDAYYKLHTQSYAG